MVDPRDDEVGLEALDQPEVGEPHAVDRRAVGGVADAAVLERHLGDPQRAPRGDRARHRRAVGVGRDHDEANVVELGERAAQRLQPVRLDPVVVGQQDVAHQVQDIPARGRYAWIECALRRRRRRAR